jgi:hypothetical protein
MTTVVDIENAVRALPEAEFMAFSAWFDAYEESCWDRQIAYDQTCKSPLLNLMEKARSEYKAGQCSRL